MSRYAAPVSCMPQPLGDFLPSLRLLGFILVLALLPSLSQAANINIGNAVWAPKTGLLKVKGNCSQCAMDSAIDLYDSSGRFLAAGTVDKQHKFLFRLPVQRPELLCSVRVKSGILAAAKPVAGLRNQDCPKQPLCQILAPANGAALAANQDVLFRATAKLKDRKANPLKLEWDFGGGAMGENISGTGLLTTYKRPDSTEATARFVRDNSRYRIRFTATDGKKRYCEDAVEVTVGTPPATPPSVPILAAEAERSAPKLGGQLAGNPGDVVVLPFPDRTMPSLGDTRYTPNAQNAWSLAGRTSLNAQVYRKDRLPKLLTDQDVSLAYSAAVNPDDPVGTGSINSTSQNWPLNSDIRKPAPLEGAAIQKTDLWDKFVRPASDKLAPDYLSVDWFASFEYWNFGTASVTPDQGFQVLDSTDHGRYMPGRDHPYSENAPQAFSAYDSREQWHTASNIPVTDIDDTGRVNPYPLMRVQAADKKTQQPLATADTVLSSAKDFQCRGCHAKGKIAANDKLDWSQFQQAFHSSPIDGGPCSWQGLCSDTFAPPAFFDSVDREGKPSTSLFDQEYAALKNASSLHDFYDSEALVAAFELGNWGAPLDGAGHHFDQPGTCYACHTSWINYTDNGASFGETDVLMTDHGTQRPYWTTLSVAMHRFHGRLQKDPGDPNKILYGSDGRPLRWDPSKGPNPNSLFPAVDAQGKPLPMEQNCLRCHSGHREPMYRDRHVTAGTTCHDCHGDMLAVGQVFAKPKPGPEGHKTRLEWFEQPDCGSCHTGNGNEGQDGRNGFFSAGVLKQAFAATDPSATSAAPKSPRFAVQPDKPRDIPRSDPIENRPGNQRKSIMSLSTPLYRHSRDTHGNVACGACHGGAHEIWPNRDPKANDNVTALQLQGYSGSVMECKVCHTQDAFAKLENLDGGQYSGLPANSGILGGPHGMHPVNDPNWWAQAADDTTPISDGSHYGGWHDNVYRKPGLNGEDQCAACHGEDHKGTRLSKTPVDLEFVVKNGKKAKWKAGEIVGCDRCHSIERSFIGGPRGYTAPVNHDPVITSNPTVTTAGMGQPYSYAVEAHDPDGDPLTFSLGTRPAPADAMTISPQGVVTTTWPADTFAKVKSPPFVFPYTVTVSDGKGGHATQTVTVQLDCPAGQSWVRSDAGVGSCVADSNGIVITSRSTAIGIHPGETYKYQVTVTDANGEQPVYSLSGANGAPPPAGMAIDSSGLVTWTPAGSGTTPDGNYSFTVQVTDSKGGSASQLVSVGVCNIQRMNWDVLMYMCM